MIQTDNKQTNWEIYAVTGLGLIGIVAFVAFVAGKFTLHLKRKPQVVGEF